MEQWGTMPTPSTSPTDPGAERPGPAAASRPRNLRGRAQNDRPRDALGRPLPHGSEGVPRQPEGIERTAEETLDLASGLLARRRPFHAHDVFEDHWKHTSGEERRLWRGLAQLAVGVTHAARGNPRGAAAVLSRSADSMAPFRGDPPHRIDVAGIRAWALTEGERLRALAGTTEGSADEGIWLEVPDLRTPIERRR